MTIRSPSLDAPRRLATALRSTMLTSLVLASACQAEPKRTVAAIEIFSGDNQVPVAQVSVPSLEQAIARARVTREDSLEAAPLPKVLRPAVIDSVVERQLLLLEAEKLGVVADSDRVEKTLATMKTDISEREFTKRLIKTYQTEADLRAHIAARIQIAAVLSRVHVGVEASDEEVAAAYAALPDAKKKRPRRVRAAQIVVRTQEEGSQVIKRLRKKGVTFAEVAKKMSVAPEGKNGGELGWFAAGVMPKVFDDVCFSLKPGQTSKLTPSDYGFHVFKVLEAEPEAELSLDSMKDKLRAQVLKSKLEAAEASYKDQLRSKYRIVRDESALAGLK